MGSWKRSKKEARTTRYITRAAIKRSASPSDFSEKKGAPLSGEQTRRLVAQCVYDSGRIQKNSNGKATRTWQSVKCWSKRDQTRRQREGEARPSSNKQTSGGARPSRSFLTGFTKSQRYQPRDRPCALVIETVFFFQLRAF